MPIITLENLANVTDQVIWTLFSPIMLIAIGLIAIFTAIDLMRHGRGQWFAQRWRNIITTFMIVAINLAFIPFTMMAVAFMQQAYDGLGIPRIEPDFWSTMPVLLPPLIYIICHDFVIYWLHRAMHTPLGWPVHAMHHSDSDVNAMTAFRIHELEHWLIRGSQIFALTWLGLTPEMVGITVTLMALHTLYVHIDVDWDHGPLRYLVASPRFHRWHHANLPEAFGKNLANHFSLWDRMFGTYYNPGPCRAKMGAPDVPDTDVVALLVYPFRAWARLFREKWLRGTVDGDQVTGTQTPDRVS